MLVDEKTLAKRRERLEKGYCPIHGRRFDMACLLQANTAPRNRYYLGNCIRKDCQVLAWASLDGKDATKLLPEWAYLCDPSAVDPGEEVRADLYARVIQAGSKIDDRWDDIPEEWRCDSLDDLFAAAEGNFRIPDRLKPMPAKKHKK